MSKVILTDIEGTITSLSFVKETLFPYSKDKLKDFILDNYETNIAVIRIIDKVNEIISNENDADFLHQGEAAMLIQESQTYTAIQALLKWIDEDRKIKPLKDLQGLIWEDGYRKQAYKGHLYQDAYEQLSNLKQAGHKLYVYSSGSIKAQELLFEYSKYGDIKNLFNGFFDTTIGHKQEVNSYNNIIKSIGENPNNIFFFSDVEEELDAAYKAGINPVMVLRPEDYPNKTITSKLNYSVISSLKSFHLLADS